MNNDIKKIIEAFDFNQVKNDKNKNAKLLNIPIISEDDFIETFGIII